MYNQIGHPSVLQSIVRAITEVIVLDATKLERDVIWGKRGLVSGNFEIVSVDPCQARRLVDFTGYKAKIKH